VEALGGRYRIVLFDHVGQGQSAPGAFEQHCYLNLDRYATDLVEVCASLKLTEAIAVGHSMGAMICLLASLQKPGLFSRLVLLCASPRYRNDEGYYGGMSDEEFGRTYRAIYENYPEWAGAYAPQAISEEHPAHFTKAFAAGLAAIPPQNVLTIACSVLQSDYRSVLPKVQVPTLIIQARGHRPTSRRPMKCCARWRNFWGSEICPAPGGVGRADHAAVLRPYGASRSRSQRPSSCRR
jgi:sigma-B regulation protein RsbQ